MEALQASLIRQLMCSEGVNANNNDLCKIESAEKDHRLRPTVKRNILADQIRF